jgi:putative heme iron utilization protein
MKFFEYEKDKWVNVDMIVRIEKVIFGYKLHMPFGGSIRVDDNVARKIIGEH